MNEPFVFDTHTLGWLVEGNPRLGRNARELAQAALQTDDLTVSAICFWEIAIVAGELAGLPGDPAGRIITATAMVGNATVPTAGQRILDWQGQLAKHDARS